MNACSETPQSIYQLSRFCGLLALLGGCADIFGWQEGKPYPPEAGDKADSSPSGDAADADSLGEDVATSVDADAGREVATEAGDAPSTTMDGADALADAGDAGDTGRSCVIGSDCANGFCNVNTHICVATQCEDGTKNGSETDIDCGGGTCPKCSPNRGCSKDEDCTTGSCSRLFCALASGPPHWLPGFAMHVPRTQFAVVAVPFGNRQAFLVAIGGSTSGGVATDTYENFDSGGTTWTAPAMMLGARTQHAAVMHPNGSVYVVGGTAPETWKYRGTMWTPASALLTRRFNLGAAVGLDDLIYTVGGVDVAGKYTGIVEVYDPTANGWTQLPQSMPTNRSALAVVAGSDGKIYAIGGYDDRALGAVESYDVQGKTWAMLSELPTPVRGPAAVVGPDDRIYAIGGLPDTGAFSRDVGAYIRTTNRWASVAPLSTGRYDASAAVAPDGRIYALGGAIAPDSRPTETVEVYGPVVSASTSSAPPGGSVTITGNNFAANATVRVYLGPVTGALLKTSTTNNSGVLTPVTLTVPNIASTTTVLTVVDDLSQYPITLFFRVN
jgi:N-acetylneuraminic acid mutarotase